MLLVHLGFCFVLSQEKLLNVLLKVHLLVLLGLKKLLSPFSIIAHLLIVLKLLQAELLLVDLLQVLLLFLSA